jgi:hypothetical protein
VNSNRNHLPKLIAALAIVCLGAALFVFLRKPPAKALNAPAPEIPRHDLVQTDGRWHRSGETNPFTGWMVDYYPAGERLSRSQISNGFLNGVSETWYTNGQMQVREHFKDGTSHGLREKWHENGARLSQATIVEGKVTGPFQSWYDNGQLAEQIEMRLGRADGTAWAYYPSGFLKAETTLHDGEVLDRKVWKDGERQPEQPRQRLSNRHVGQAEAD